MRGRRQAWQQFGRPLVGLALFVVLTSALGLLLVPTGAQVETAAPSSVWGLALAQIVLLGGLLLLAALCVGRPLRDSERGARALTRGELQRPMVISSAATAELHDLQLAWEELRRALLTKLRSSTELNLQLEAEVARRSAELSRRNDELSDALSQLRSTQDDLVRTEKLAAVGELAAGVTSAICEPVRSMAAVPAALAAELAEIERLQAPCRAGSGSLSAEAGARIAELQSDLDRRLAELGADANRVRDIIRTLRLYARPELPLGAASVKTADQLAAILKLVDHRPFGPQ